jgi:hypothetical protein
MEGLAPEQLERVGKSLSVQFVVEPLHLDPSHRTIAVVEAPSVEAVAEFVYQTGLFQWNSVEVSPITPISKMMERVMEFPTVFE